MNTLLFGIPRVETEFRPVEFEDIDEICSLFSRYPSPSCDYSLTGLMMWRDYYDYHIAILDDTLFIRGLDPVTGLLIYYMPTGPMDPDHIMDTVRDDARQRDAAIVRCSPEWLDIPQHADIPSCAIRMPHWDDYCYDIRQFTHFEGRKMEKKRNHLNFFRNHYPDAKISPITADDFPDICIFAQTFGKMHEDSTQFSYENSHCTDMLPVLGRNNLFGITVRIGGELIGFAYGEVIGDMFFAHVEKGNIAYRGIYQALASAMAREAERRGAGYVNREDDAGDESLRRSKESYHPVMMVRKFLLPL